MEELASILVCAGCGTEVAADEPLPFRCRAAREGDDIDHVLRRRLGGGVGFADEDDEPNPFVRFRERFHAYHVARANGVSDAEYVELVRSLDRMIARVGGTGFVETPFGRSDELSSAMGFSSGGGIWVKDETENVSGSHKGRHLMGVLIWLAVAERVGLLARDGRRLAIASCGNAAVAAAVEARAADRPLDVYVPTWADPTVVADLERLNARIHVVPREDGEMGDPTYRRLHDAVRDGAIPFTCQGGDNGLAVEGGCTLGYEIAGALRRSRSALDRIVVQVGGGALASAVSQGLREAVEAGILERMPALDTVQTEGVHPLERAYERVAALVPAGAGAGGAVAAAVTTAAHRRSDFMWPWEEEPKSVATGILDDETYDWAAVVEGMLRSGGTPVVVTEELLEEANALARETTGIDVDHTGSAGLAGVLALLRGGTIRRDDRIGVLFTGIRR
jgi:threonine synthase